MKISTKTILLTALLSLACFSGACTRKSSVPTTEVTKAETPTPPPQYKTPEEVVQHFIELSATAKGDVDRQRLQELCSGEMRRTFERMTPEAFRIAYLSNNVKLKNIQILEKKLAPESATIHYSVSIDNEQGTDLTKESNEREVELSMSQGSWFIDTIRPKGSDKIAFTRGMIF